VPAARTSMPLQRVCRPGVAALPVTRDESPRSLRQKSKLAASSPRSGGVRRHFALDPLLNRTEEESSDRVAALLSVKVASRVRATAADARFRSGRAAA